MTADRAEKYPVAPDSGAVELDAMEELDPGLLGRIVGEAVAQFRDAVLAHEVEGTVQAAQEAVDETVQEAVADELAAVEEIKAEAEEIYERHRAPLFELAAELDEELAPLDGRLERIQNAVAEKLASLQHALPPLPEGVPEAGPDDEGWLFDSRRGYREQLRHYKER
jgi:hypothetical protein